MSNERVPSIRISRRNVCLFMWGGVCVAIILGTAIGIYIVKFKEMKTRIGIYRAMEDMRNLASSVGACCDAYNKCPLRHDFSSVLSMEILLPKLIENELIKNGMKRSEIEELLGEAEMVDSRVYYRVYYPVEKRVKHLTITYKNDVVVKIEIQ